jgi:hypothetical protein
VPCDSLLHLVSVSDAPAEATCHGTPLPGRRGRLEIKGGQRPQLVDDPLARDGQCFARGAGIERGDVSGCVTAERSSLRAGRAYPPNLL